jgi:hypothetical protein
MRARNAHDYLARSHKGRNRIFLIDECYRLSVRSDRCELQLAFRDQEANGQPLPKANPPGRTKCYAFPRRHRAGCVPAERGWSTCSFSPRHWSAIENQQWRKVMTVCRQVRKPGAIFRSGRRTRVANKRTLLKECVRLVRRTSSNNVRQCSLRSKLSNWQRRKQRRIVRSESR